MQTVITDNFSNAEGNDYVDAVAAEFNRLGLINNPTYNNLRSNIIADPVVHKNLYDALAVSLNALTEFVAVIEAINLTNFRDDRDEINAALARIDILIDGESASPPTVRRLVREVLRNGKDFLQQYREELRERIKGITGDPDG